MTMPEVFPIDQCPYCSEDIARDVHDQCIAQFKVSVLPPITLSVHTNEAVRIHRALIEASGIRYRQDNPVGADNYQRLADKVYDQMAESLGLPDREVERERGLTIGKAVIAQVIKDARAKQ